MPAPGASYQIVRQARYAKEFARIEDEQIISEIQAAEQAIANAPYDPVAADAGSAKASAPAKLYKRLPARENTGGTEPIGLMVAVRKLRIRKNGYVLKYTIRESGQLVILEDLDLPFPYNVSGFQPRTKS